MALIKCKKCGKEISDKASKCVNCGYKKSNLKWLFITLGILFFLLFCSFIGLIVFIIISSSKYTGTWTQITDYYDKNDHNKFICRVESRLIIDDIDKIQYISEVTKGECNYEKIYVNGYYDFDGFNITAEFSYPYDDEDIDIIYNDEYICYENCSTKKNHFFKNVSESNIYIEYIDYYQDSQYDDNYNHYFDMEDFEYDNYTRITYEDYKKLLNSPDKFIIFIGSNTCPYCHGLDEELDDIDEYYRLPVIYYLDINNLTEDEETELYSDLNQESFVPILRLYNNGFKDTIDGYQNKNTLIDIFKKYNMFNNSLV